MFTVVPRWHSWFFLWKWKLILNYFWIPWKHPPRFIRKFSSEIALATAPGIPLEILLWIPPEMFQGIENVAWIASHIPQDIYSDMSLGFVSEFSLRFILWTILYENLSRIDSKIPPWISSEIPSGIPPKCVQRTLQRFLHNYLKNSVKKLGVDCFGISCIIFYASTTGILPEILREISLEIFPGIPLEVPLKILPDFSGMISL